MNNIRLELYNDGNELKQECQLLYIFQCSDFLVVPPGVECLPV